MRLSKDEVKVRVWISQFNGEQRFACYFRVGRNTIKMFGPFISEDELLKAAKGFGANGNQLTNISSALAELLN